jgi:A118 family predicted phage portal protein
MLDRFMRWLRGVLGRMIKKTDANRIGVSIAVSDTMQAAIHRWKDMYMGIAPWITGPEYQSLRIPALVASEVAMLVSLESEINVSGSVRGDWLSTQMEAVRDNLKEQVEYACAMGGLFFKPYADGNTVAVDYVQADDAYPIAFNSRKEITSALFIERKAKGDKKFIKLEIHELTDAGYTIINRAFRGTNDYDLAQEVALTEVDEWADLEPEVTSQDIKFPLFGYLRIPLGNTIDPKSPVGMSVYEKASDVIKEADLQYQRLLWEFKGGELAVDAVEDAFTIDPTTRQAKLPVGQERLFRPNKLDPKQLTADTLFKTFSPDLRDESYIRGLNKLLQHIEDLCGVSRGTLSDPNVDARTAAEIKMSKQRTYATVTSIQRATEKAIRGLVRAMDATASIYKLCPPGKYDLSFVWDDSIVVDAETERVRDMQEVNAGLMQQWEYRMKWRGESDVQAKAAIAGTATGDNPYGFQ